MLTLVIPTRNRPYFLGRLLGYYALVGCPYPILIGDSSDGDCLAEVQRLEKTYSARCQVLFNYYPHDPTLGPGGETTKLMVKLLEQVKTPYVIFNQDDDLFVPKALEKCVAFLETHSDYSLAHGVALRMDIENGGPFGRILGTSEYPHRSYDFPKAEDRYLFYMMGRGGNAQFSVKRTPNCLEGWHLAYQLKLDNYFEEHFNNALAAIQGKFKKIEGLYLIRQTHPAMISRVKDFFDWVIDPSFSKNYHDFSKILSGALAKKDHIKEEEAFEIIRKGFWFDLANTLERKWKSKYIQKSFKLEVKKCIKNSKINAVRMRIRSFLPSGQLTLPALLRSSSPFHSDFLPLYKTISNGGISLS